MGDVPTDGFAVFFHLLWKYLSPKGIEIESSPYYSLLGSGIFDPVSKLRISRSMRKSDIIYAPDDMGFLLKRKSTPLILGTHLYRFDPAYQPYTDYKQKIYQKVFLEKYVRKSYQVADAIVVPSQSLACAVANDYPQIKPSVIHNGVDTELFRPMNVEDPFSGKVKMLFVGNWIKRKGVDLFPEIMDHLGEDFVLMHVGLRKKSVPTDGERKIKSYPSLPHSSEALARLYNSCDIFVFPSRLEGLPLSVIEAMSCGKPVVAANCSSLPELVVDGKGGYLCEMDNVENFVERIRHLAFDAELRKKMGMFNRKRAIEKFTYQQMGEKYLAFFRGFL